MTSFKLGLLFFGVGIFSYLQSSVGFSATDWAFEYGIYVSSLASAILAFQAIKKIRTRTLQSN